MNAIREVLHKVPGEKVFGIYRFLPIFFICGAALEFTMIKWEVRGINFYKTYKRRQAERLAVEEFYLEQNLYPKKVTFRRYAFQQYLQAPDPSQSIRYSSLKKHNCSQ